MAVTLSSVSCSHLPGGEVIVRGLATLDGAYANGGEVMDLSSYILSSSSPTVLVGDDDGHQCTHSRGTAAAGKILAYNEAAAANATALAAVATNTNMAAVVVHFIAIGQAT